MHTFVPSGAGEPTNRQAPLGPHEREKPIHQSLFVQLQTWKEDPVLLSGAHAVLVALWEHGLETAAIKRISVT